MEVGRALHRSTILPIAACALAFFAGILPAEAVPAPVFVARDPAAIRQYQVDRAVVRGMVDRLLLALTGAREIGAAWRTLVDPKDKVGLKVCAAGGELFTTHAAVVEAVVAGLRAAGVPAENIIVWDRQIEGAKAAGYRANGYRLVGIEPRTGYDGTAAITSPLLGKLIWGDLRYVPHFGANPISSETENTSNESHLAKILTQQVTKVINLPVLSASETTGVAGCLYNMTLPNIDNSRRYTQYGRVSASALAGVYAEPAIAKKVVLHLMDGLVAAYADGPESQPNYAVHEATLFASRDPVAIDTLALARLEQLRRGAHLPALEEQAGHVAAAGALGLGEADPARIPVREVGR